MKEEKVFTVEITRKGSERAYPSIWYAGMDGFHFEVRKSKQWPSVYEVVKTGKIIDPADCKKVNPLKR